MGYKPPVRALVLAAGLGTRLRPFTDVVPKPLLPFLGPTVLEAALAQLEAAGIADVAINTHHLPDAFGPFLENHPFRMRITESYEPEILGTGGAMAPLAGWIGDEHLLIYNGDVIADIALDALIARHLASGAEATMALLARGAAGKTPVHQSEGRIRAIGGPAPAGTTPHSFACAHVLSPAFLRRLPKSGFHNVIDTYQDVLAQGGLVAATLHDGAWFDMGTPGEYWAALHGVACTPKGATCRANLAVLAQRLKRLSPLTEPALREAMDRGVFWLASEPPPRSPASLANAIVLPGAPWERWSEFSGHIAGHGHLLALPRDLA